MAATKEIGSAIAEVYAKSLLELASQQNVADEVLDAFAGIAELLRTDDDFAAFMTSATIDAGSRKKSLEKIFSGQINDLLLRTLLVLNDRGRANIVEDVFVAYRTLLEAQQGQIEVEVIAAHEFGQVERDQLAAELSRLTGKQAILEIQVDPDLIGGFIVRIGDRQIDASVRRQLAMVKDALQHRASKEIHSGRIYFDETN